MTYEELLIKTALEDERIIVMTAENRALVRNVPKALGSRFIDTGITEQTLVGMAAGLALRGRIPVVHALAPFLTMRAFEFIRTDVGIAGLPVKLSGYIPGVLSDGNGPTHQSIEDVSIMRGIPGMEVFCPADEDDLVKMLPAIWASPAPSYVRINHKAGSYKHSAFEMGRAEVITGVSNDKDVSDDSDVSDASYASAVAEGTDVTLLVYGFLFENALKAKNILEQEGLKVALVNMRSLKPVDETIIVQSACKSGLLVTIEDHLLTGGLYSIVAEVLLKHRVTATVLPLALKERWFKPGLLHDVLANEGFTGEKIAERILTELSAEAR
jgi:transketolase